jgi:hypothetical protein
MLAVVLAVILLAKWLCSWGAKMAKVGRFVTDPRAGTYCQITLEAVDEGSDRGVR